MISEMRTKMKTIILINIFTKMVNLINTAKNLYNDIKEANKYDMTKMRSSKWPDDRFTNVWRTEVPLEKKLKVYNEYKNSPSKWEDGWVKYWSFNWTREDWVPVDYTIEMREKQPQQNNAQVWQRMPQQPKAPADATTDAELWEATHQFGYWNDPRTVYQRYRNWKKKTVTATKKPLAKYKGNISL